MTPEEVFLATVDRHDRWCSTLAEKTKKRRIGPRDGEETTVELQEAERPLAARLGISIVEFHARFSRTRRETANAERALARVLEA